MTDTDDESEPLVDWKIRLDRVRRENGEIYMFVKDGEDDGTISKEASRACFAASVAVYRKAGIIEPQMEAMAGQGDGVDDAALCTVVAQANHEARVALLKAQPELEDALNERVPPSRGGRAP